MRPGAQESAREQKIAPETLKALWNPILLMYVKVQINK
jgi:hypothetical protein